MQKRNATVLLIILGLTGIWMGALHLVVFPDQGYLGISGIGMVAVILMIINKEWLVPGAEPLPRQALNRSILLAAALGTIFSLMFGGLGL